MDAPKTLYAKSGDVHVAYQVVGRGPIDLVISPGAPSHLMVYWESPDMRAFLEELTRFARLIIFDKRGTGLSDRVAGLATLEDRMDDIRAVMDAAGSRRAWHFGAFEGAAMSILFAATYPERTLGLILCGGYARGRRAPDYPWGDTEEDSQRLNEAVEKDFPGWVEDFGRTLAPSRASDPEFKSWVSRLLQLSHTPGSVVTHGAMNQLIDVRPILPAVHVPTLVLHASGDQMAFVDEGRYIAEQIPGAKFVEIDGVDHFFFVQPNTRAFVVEEIRRFVRGLQRPSEADRILKTVLFTDIVGSTQRLSSLGDREWGRLLNQHFSIAREEIVRFRGREVKTLGDGIVATFDGPTRAVRCACAIRDRSRTMGLDVRAGLHTGECVLTDTDIEGIAVHFASRVMEKARPGEVLASGTVRDLSAGSDLRFVDRGTRSLKGVQGRWRIYSADDPERK